MNNYEKIIYENTDKGYQYRVTLNSFRDTEYLHIRKYFLSYEGDWVPTKEGASIPATIQNTFALLDGLIDICSNAETVDSIVTHLSNKINNLKVDA